MTETKDKSYIGDGVYASFDGWQIWLETERGFGRIEKIALEPEVFRSLIAYAKTVGWKVPTVSVRDDSHEHERG